jgi:hypothetical protein
VWLLVVAGCYALAWRLVPHQILFWLGFPFVLGLAWAASLSGREILSTLIVLLRRLERL